MSPAELDAWLIEYVAAEESVFGWDWKADLAYARASGADPRLIHLMEETLRVGQGPGMYASYYSPGWQAVRKARTAALARLTRKGALTAAWAGLPVSVTGGATRTREWRIT